MKFLAILLALAAAAFAAVDGTVVNQTTGKPAPGADITIFKLTQNGPEQIATAKSDASGHFSSDVAIEPGPHLIEVLHDGITYNTMAPPGRPTTGLQLNVFDASKDPATAPVAQHIVLLEPSAQQLAVTETFLLDNNGKLTYNDNDAGTLHFFVPAAAKDSLKVNATEPGGMALEQFPTAAKRKGEYTLPFPIKPGETRIDVAYTLPAASFSGQTLYPATPTRLVAPGGVSLQGDGLKSLGAEPQTGANIYETTAATYQVAVQGTGSLRGSQNAAASSGGESDDSAPTMRVIAPPGFEDRRLRILVLALVALAFGFVLLYRKGQATPAGGKSRS